MAAVVSSRTLLEETLGAKLRRLSRDADLAPAALPWTLPPAWAQSTAYLGGQVVSANGSWWGAAISGTSASSGAGPATLDTAGVVVDGTQQWLSIGGPTIAANDPLAPSITLSGSAPSGIPLLWHPTSRPDLFRLYGGYPNPTVKTSWWPATLNTSDSTLHVARFASIVTRTNAPKFALGTGAFEGGYSVLVDGRPLYPGAYVNGSSAKNLIVDFGPTSGRKVRTVELVKGGGVNGLGAFFTARTDEIFPPATQDDVRVAIVSDSQLAGHAFGPTVPTDSIVYRLGRLMGWSDVWNMSIGGTGWIAGGASYNFRQRLPQVLALNPDVVVFMGSTNDTGQSSSAMTAQVQGSISDLRVGGYRGPIVVFGVLPGRTVSTNALEDMVQAGVAAANDPLTFFLPISLDPKGPWLTNAANIKNTWQPSTAYALYQPVAANGAIYMAMTAGTSAASGTGPSGPGPGIVDGAVTWNKQGDGPNSASIAVNLNDNIHLLTAWMPYIAERMAKSIKTGVLPKLR